MSRLRVLSGDAHEAIAIEEGAQRAGLLGAGPRGLVHRLSRVAGLLAPESMQLAADLAQAAQAQRVVDIRRPRLRLDQAGLAQPLHVVHDGARRQRCGRRQLLNGHALAFGEQSNDAQPRCVRKRFEGGQ